MIPSSWSVDKTVQGLQQTGKLGNWFAEVSDTSCADSIFASVIVVVRMLLVQVSLEEIHTSRLPYEFENEVTQQVSRKSDEIDGMRLEKTLGSCQVFGP